MNLDERIISGNEMIKSIMNLTPLSGNDMSTVWAEVVSKIGSKKNNGDKVSQLDAQDDITLGERIAANSQAVDLKNGVLLIEVKHSGWIQYIKMYQKFILNGLKWSLPNLKISGLAFRLAGENVSLSDSYDSQLKKDQSKMHEKLDEQEKKLQKMNTGKEEKSKNELPADFLALFDKLNKSVEDSSN